MPRSTTSRDAEPIKVFLIDHVPTFRDNLRHIITQRKTLSVIGEADQAEKVLSGNVFIDADVAVVDVDLPYSGAFEVSQWLLSHNQRIAVLLLTYWDWDPYLVGAKAVGARGLLLRSTATLDLVQGIERSAGGSIFTREELNRIRKWDETYGPVFRSLRPREWQVLWLAADGMKNHAIAAKLDLSESTVDKLMTTVLDKFNLNSRAQLLSLVYNQHLGVLRSLENNRLLTFP
jgi:NarL family two-component system response regulator YdfI